jgi:hypothetical protein
MIGLNIKFLFLFYCFLAINIYTIKLHSGYVLSCRRKFYFRKNVPSGKHIITPELTGLIMPFMKKQMTCAYHNCYSKKLLTKNDSEGIDNVFTVEKEFCFLYSEMIL